MRLLGASSVHTFLYAVYEPIDRAVMGNEIENAGQQVENNDEIEQEQKYDSALHGAPRSQRKIS